MNLDQKVKGGYSDKERYQKRNQNSVNSKHDHLSKGFLSDSQNGSTSEKCVRHICGKLGNNVLSVDGDGKPCVQYVACKIFVGLKPRERNKLLYKKRLCCKCLTPGIKWDTDHFCNRAYKCNQTYVKNGKELKCGKHILMCGYHANEMSNEDILELYQKNVIRAHGKFNDFYGRCKHFVLF